MGTIGFAFVCLVWLGGAISGLVLENDSPVWFSRRQSLSSSYVAGSVQYYPFGNYQRAPAENIEQNLEAYEQFAIAAGQQSVDILVFPEAGLGWIYGEVYNTRSHLLPYCEVVPDVTSALIDSNEAVIPCTSILYDTRPQLQRASCMALKNSLYLVINMCEISYCLANVSGCPPDGRYQFNSNVVFGRDGRIVTKYRKSHLFGGSGVFNQPAVPDAVFFDTDFGVRFGVFICFDIEFLQPAVQLVEEYNITDFVYSSWWANQPPAFSAGMFQQGFSRLHSVNLVASNTGTVYNGGGGIYSQGRPLIFEFNNTILTPTNHGNEWMHALPSQEPFQNDLIEQPSRLLLVASVPILSSKPSPSSSASSASSFFLPSLTSSPISSSIIVQQCVFESGPGIKQVPMSCILFDIDLYPVSTEKLQLTAGSISCALESYHTQTVVSSSSSKRIFALLGFQGTIQYPFTPDPLDLEYCIVSQCRPVLDANNTTSFVTCAKDWKSEGYFDDLHITATNLSSHGQVFPMGSYNNGIPINPSFLSFAVNIAKENSTSWVKLSIAEADSETNSDHEASARRTETSSKQQINDTFNRDPVMIHSKDNSLSTLFGVGLYSVISSE